MTFNPERKTLANRKRLERKSKDIDMEAVYEMVEKGKSIKEICEYFGCSRDTLYRHHHDYQNGNPVTKRKYIKGNYVPATKKNVDVEKIMEEIDAGETLDSISKKYYVSIVENNSLQA